jgi:hypothetical protein
MDDWQRMKAMEEQEQSAGGEYEDEAEDIDATVDQSDEYVDAPFDDDSSDDEPEIQTLGGVKQRKAAG